MGNKKVSVVIATYNQEKYIRHTLESVVNQKTNFEFEALVGDDCSTDGTAAVVREFAEKYPDIIVPFIREKNLGMGGNTADLVFRTSGEYVAFIEGDDYWIDDYKLQKQVDFLDSHQDYVACFGLCQIVDENEVRQPDREQYSGFMKEGGDEAELKMADEDPAYQVKATVAEAFDSILCSKFYRLLSYGMLVRANELALSGLT